MVSQLIAEAGLLNQVEPDQLINAWLKIEITANDQLACRQPGSERNLNKGLLQYVKMEFTYG